MLRQNLLLPRLGLKLLTKAPRLSGLHRTMSALGEPGKNYSKEFGDH